MSERRLTVYPVPPGRNSLWYWPKAKHPLRVIYNFLLITLSRYVPSLRLKNFILRRTGMKVGRDVAVGVQAVFDYLWPELITLEDNCIIGYNATILCHEFLVEEYRLGPVVVGHSSVVAANATVLPGVQIGRNAVVSAASLVNRDIPDNAFAGGVPARVLSYRNGSTPS
ncbi:MAG: acyltransferase [Eubacteriales bacterium]|nr:acyltransferase [Bacillota bacterium]MBV1728454.1 acyltransferase [Desulforudis sp.]MDP3050287.1 acyltransferase [Eubacteriales bacterium]MBU4553722.1 acyltransferase [Bacillota bacterium]MBV1736085.1 acyltransferase [Desulforudis sp.]